MCKKVKITVLRKAFYADLAALYENPLETPCDMQEGRVFVSEEAACPPGLCPTAWETLAPFVRELAQGGGHFYDNWMRNPHSALLSCNDGIRPVSFLVETIE